MIGSTKLNGPRAVKTDMAQEGDGVVGCNVILGGNSATLLLTVGQKAKLESGIVSDSGAPR